MDITDVRIRVLENSSKMKAVASMTIDDAFVIHDIKIIEGDNGLFIAMPSKKIGETYKDIAHPLNGEVRKQISDAILAAYNQL